MGWDKDVKFTGKTPSWAVLRDKLNKSGLPIQLRMIDGALAAPDDVVPVEWRELRISTANGMITLKRTSTGVTCVVFGNASDELKADVEGVAKHVQEMAG